MRRWIKLWCKECLTGSIRFDFTPAERSVWYDLLALAGESRKDGTIAANNEVPYPHEWIAGTLNIPIKLLESVLIKCKQTDRILEDNHGIHLNNWAKYQSEYDRQRPYRKAKQDGSDPARYVSQRHGHLVKK